MQNNNNHFVTLRNRHLEAWISPQHGASIARLFEPRSGFQVLRPTALDDIALGETMKFGCFPMIPYSNRIGFRQMAFGDRIFPLDGNRPGAPHSFHGNAWMAAWRIDALRDNHLSVSYRHVAGDGHWPFPYLARQSFTLDGGRCRMRLSLLNTGTHAFPAGAGWHPFFTIEPASRISFHADRVWRNDDDMLPCALLPATGEWWFGDGRPTQGLAVDNCFQGWQGKAVLEHPRQRRSIVISGGKRLSSLVVFRPTDGREFVAIEPVTHVNNGINLMAQGRTDTGVRILQPGQCLEVASEIEVRNS